MIWSSPYTMRRALMSTYYRKHWIYHLRKMVERALGYTLQGPAVSACWALQKCVEYVIDEAKSKCRRANPVSNYATFMTAAAAS